jgi:hypothetical protein
MGKIRLTELVSNQGIIAKKYTIASDGTFTNTPAAAIYNAVAQVKELDLEEVGPYLDSLTSRNDTCITLGVCGEPGQEFRVVTEGERTAETISRTSQFFDFCNSGNFSLMYLDFDSEATDTVRQTFLAELDITLADAIHGEHSNKSICRWQRKSTSASAKINGKVGDGLHVYLAVKGAKAELITLIHKWCWQQKYCKDYKMTKSAVLKPQSLVDQAVGNSERIVYSSDAVVDGAGAEKFYEHVDRTCNYQPGGVLDCEIAIQILQELTADYDREWLARKQKLEHSSEVKEARKVWKQVQIDRKLACGLSPKAAKFSAEKLAEGILLANESLLRNDRSEVTVQEILTDPDTWADVKKFCCPIRRDVTRNVGMILGDADHMVLHIFSGGEINYKLMWDYDSLAEWIENCDIDELEDNASRHLNNLAGSNIQQNKLINITCERLGVTKASVKEDVKEAAKSKEEVIQAAETTYKYEEEGATTLGANATQGDILDDYLARQGDCKAYGGGLYVWDGGTIWNHQTTEVIKKKVRQEYNHVVKCTRANDYNAITRLIVEDEGVKVNAWEEVPGFPCSSDFYAIQNNTVEKIPYTKDLGCRFRMKINPDYTLKTPYFDKIIANVKNPVLFQQLFGLALSGYLPSTQRAFIMYGDGGSGKGTTEDVMAAMLPSKRLTSMNLEQLNDPTYLIQLADSRVNFVSEIKKKGINLTGAKLAIGGGLIAGRALFRDPVYFYANCSFIISFNQMFPLESIGNDIERRFGHTIVHFKREPGQEQIDGLRNMIIEKELPGVLAWAIEGIKSYFEFGLEDKHSLAMFEKWCSTVDPIAAFFDECIEFVPRSRGILCKELWNKFKEFLDESHFPSDVSKRVFKTAVTDNKKIGESVRYKDNLYYSNIRFSKIS